MSKYSKGDHLVIQEGDAYHFMPVGTEVTVMDVTDDVSPSGLGRIYMVTGTIKGDEIVQAVAEVALQERQSAEV